MCGAAENATSQNSFTGRNRNFREVVAKTPHNSMAYANKISRRRINLAALCTSQVQQVGESLAEEIHPAARLNEWEVILLDQKPSEARWRNGASQERKRPRESAAGPWQVV
jgi:hypothetical protein